MTPHLFPDYRPAIWRGMTGMDLQAPVAGIGFMTFDGEFQQFLLSDLDLRRMVEQVIHTVPSHWARQMRTLFQRSRVDGNAAVAGSMPRGVGSNRDIDEHVNEVFDTARRLSGRSGAA